MGEWVFGRLGSWRGSAMVGVGVVVAIGSGEEDGKQREGLVWGRGTGMTRSGAGRAVGVT